MTNAQIIGQAIIDAVSFTLFLILLFGATYFIGEVFRCLWKDLTKKLVQFWTSCTYKKSA